jgi:hypothetical protein
MMVVINLEVFVYVCIGTISLTKIETQFKSDLYIEE